MSTQGTQGTENRPTSAVKLERRLQRNLLPRGRRLGVRLLGRVQTVDVGLVMSRMVQLHDLLRNMGFECLSRVDVCTSVAPLVRTTLSRTHVVVVGQVWERVDRGDAAWSDKRAHESWFQRSFCDGQHGETSKASSSSFKDDEWMRAERQKRHTHAILFSPILNSEKV